MRLPKLIDRTSGVLLHPTSLPGGDWGHGARDGRFPGRRRPELVADAAGRADRVRQLALQRAVGVRGEPRPGQRRAAGRRRNPRRRGGSARPPARAPAGAFIAVRRRWHRRSGTFAASPKRRATGWTTSRSTARSRARTARCSGRAGRRRCAIATPTRWRGSATSTRGDRLRALRAVALLRRLAGAARVRARARRRRSSATCRSSSPTTAPTSGRTAGCSISTTRASRRWWPACRPTTSAPPASAGATRSTAGPRCAPPGSPGGSPASASTLALFDAVRLDHFIGFTRYWEIPAREPTADQRPLAARPGRAASSARSAPRSASCRSSPRISARSRRRSSRCGRGSGSPASSSCSSRSGPIPQAPSFLPHNYPRAAVAYTGTHDNDTTVGWFSDLGSGTRSADQAALERRTALRYLGASDDDDGREIHWRMIRAIMALRGRRGCRPGAGPPGPRLRGAHEPPRHRGRQLGVSPRRPARSTPAIADRLRALAETYGRGRPQRETPPHLAAAAGGRRSAAIRSGTRTRSSTRCASARSTTPTATASATSAGSAAKLDYLQDLGVTAIWLLPFYPSPLRDDGYDIADYTDVHPDCGTLADFDLLLERGAPARPARHHRAGAEPHLRPASLVPARAPRAGRVASSATSTSGATRPSATATRASSSRTSSRRTGPGIRQARAYFWHRFYAHQPDLNFDNPAVHEALFEVVDFWFGQGGRRAAARRRALPLRGGGDELREPPRDARVPEEAARARRRASSRTGCCSPRRTSGPRTPPPTSATATSAT